MKYKISLLITLLFFSSCRHSDQSIQISSAAPQLTIDKYYNKKLNLRVADDRENKNFIGFENALALWKFDEQYKNPNYAADKKLAKLNNDQDLSAIILQKLSANLDQKGLKLKRFTTNQLKVEILELGFVSTNYRDVAYSKIRVTVSNKNSDLSKIYDKQIIHYKPLLGLFLKKEYHNQIINECLDQNIQAIINDNLLWNFLD
ncbi:MAG: YajG family lipoprotein [Pseudomonadota bacterium]